MPYRLNPNDKRCVEYQSGNRWRTEKCHESEEKARQHLAALNINVSEAHTEKPK